MQVNRKKIPDKFYCEICQPRSVNANRAKLKQTIFCKNLQKKTKSIEQNLKNETLIKKTIIYDEDDYEEYTSEDEDNLNQEDDNDENTNDSTNSNPSNEYFNHKEENETDLQTNEFYFNQNLKNVSNIDLYDNEDDDLNKFKDSELDGHNDRLMDESNTNSNHTDILNNSSICSPSISIPSPLMSTKTATTSQLTKAKTKSNKSNKKTNDDKENGNRMNKTKLKKNQKDKLIVNINKKTINKSTNDDCNEFDDDDDNDSKSDDSKLNDNDSISSSKTRKPFTLSEKFNFKKVKRNQYSNKFVKFQMKLTEPNSLNQYSFNTSGSSSNHSNKSTVSSLLAASELSKQNASNTPLDNKIQVNKRGSLKDIVKNDCIKLFKANNLVKEQINDKKIICRIKSTQLIEPNQIVGEYIGRVQLANEYSIKKDDQKTKNPFVVFYKLESDQDETNFCIDSSSIGNITRFIRKSCSSNCKLKHIIDTNGHVHFVIVAINSITKGAEITLPFDYEKLLYETKEKLDDLNDFIDFNYCVCNCQNEKCFLRDSIIKHTDDQPVSATKSSDLKYNSLLIQIQTILTNFIILKKGSKKSQ